MRCACLCVCYKGKKERNKQKYEYEIIFLTCTGGVVWIDYSFCHYFLFHEMKSHARMCTQKREGKEMQAYFSYPLGWLGDVSIMKKRRRRRRKDGL
mmetsp:Transcript_11647/g.16629  ORF Transcript_11647/g.16629 Transcript_11647/m.16629 type:complete len:96 (-) Transcript_11647:145-432(-)